MMYSTKLDVGLNSISTTGKQASSLFSFLDTITEISFFISTLSSIRQCVLGEALNVVKVY